MRRFERMILSVTTYTVVWTIIADVCFALGRVTLSAHDAGSQWWREPIFFHWAGNVFRATYSFEILRAGLIAGFLGALIHHLLWGLLNRWPMAWNDSTRRRSVLAGLMLGLCIGSPFEYSWLSWCGFMQGVWGAILGMLPFLIAGYAVGFSEGNRNTQKRAGTEISWPLPSRQDQ